MVGRIYRYPGYFRLSYRTPGIIGYRYWGRTERAEMSDTGVEFVPDLTGVFGRVLRSYRTNTGTPGIMVEGIPVPGVCLCGRNALPEVPGSGIQVLSYLPKCQAPELSSHGV